MRDRPTTSRGATPPANHTSGDRLLARGDPEYPRSFDSLSRPPLAVRLRGALEGSPRVAIVGTRSADPEAEDFTRSLARGLAAAGVVVVSGGARGIDRAAHEGSLLTGRGGLAVLPSGFEPPYPREHVDLFARLVAAGGGLLTELPDRTAPRPWTMLRRNELVAALADAVVVVQAPRASGALSTAAHARALARRILVVPASPWDPRGVGALELLRGGAEICTSAADVLLTLPSAPVLKTVDETGEARAEPDELVGDEGTVYRALGHVPRHPDELVHATTLSVQRVNLALLGLLLSGRIDERGGGRYVRAPRAS